MFITLTGDGTIGIGEAALDAILGYSVVFLGLVLLMFVIILVGKVMTAKESGSAAPAAPAAELIVPAEPETPKAPPAPGTAGEVRLYGTPDRDAALIMAIVADRMGKPINELRFISIKEVK